MLTTILALLVIAIVLFLVVIQRQPTNFTVERSAHIPTPAAVIFPLVNDFHQWDRWSPWANLDPEMKTTFSGSDSGTGASYAWTGNRSVGEGRMTITESLTDERIEICLEFLKPFKATNQATFTFSPSGDGTLVHWIMDGNNKFIGKVIGLFMDMDAMMGKSFTQGLDDMRKAAEHDSATSRET